MSLRNWLMNRFKHPDTVQYSYHMGPNLTNGAQEAVFNQEFSLPVILTRGSGRVAGSLAVTQPSQLRVQQAVTVSGIGGLQAGQIVLQPLVHQNDLGTI